VAKSVGKSGEKEARSLLAGKKGLQGGNSLRAQSPPCERWGKEKTRPASLPKDKGSSRRVGNQVFWGRENQYQLHNSARERRTSTRVKSERKKKKRKGWAVGEEGKRKKWKRRGGKLCADKKKKKKKRGEIHQKPCRLREKFTECVLRQSRKTGTSAWRRKRRPKTDKNGANAQTSEKRGNLPFPEEKEEKGKGISNGVNAGKERGGSREKKRKTLHG